MRRLEQQALVGAVIRLLLGVCLLRQVCCYSGPRRGCRLEVDVGGGAPRVYWRMGAEECEQDGPQRRALGHPGEDVDCGESHRWLAKWKVDQEDDDALFQAACDGGSIGGDVRWTCVRNYIGHVQAVDADDCGARAYIDKYAASLEVVERDAEEQLIEIQSDDEVSVQEGGGTRRHILQGARQQVELNGLMDESVQWYLDRIDQRSLPLDGFFTYGNTASKATIYVVDTGVFAEHEQFLTNVGGTSRVLPGYTAKTLTGASVGGRDCKGHGTGCASVAAGLWSGSAKSAAVVPVSVTDCRGRGTQTDILDGLSWVGANLRAPAVLSMSLGTAISDVLDAAVVALLNKGLSVVVAAGNSGVDACLGSPGRVSGVITVGASDRSDQRWRSPSGLSSNVGECVDIFAPGEYFAVADIDSTVAQQGLSGTSVACPLVAGVVAQVLHAYPHANPVNVKDTIQMRATPGAVTTFSPSGTTSSLINSWNVIDAAARDLDPYLVLQQRSTSPPPPPRPPPTPAPTMAPTTPAPTMAPGGKLTVDWDEATLPLGGGLMGAGITWHASAFGLPVLATVGCTAFDVRMATAALAMLLDVDSDGKHDNEQLLGAMTASNATLLLYSTAAGGDAVLAKLSAMGGNATVVGLTCADEDDGRPSSERSGLTRGDDDEPAITPLLLTVESAEEAALCLLYLAGYARLFPQRLGWEQRDSELWDAIAEATQDCGFTEPSLVADFGWSTYCTGIYSVYDNSCGPPCVAARYVQLVMYALLGGLPTNAAGMCPQRGLKWDTCDALPLEQSNPTGFALLTDSSFGLPATLPSTAYFGDGSLQVGEPTATPPPPTQSLPLTPTPTPQFTPDVAEPEETGTPASTPLASATTASSMTASSSSEPQSTPIAEYEPVSGEMYVLINEDIMVFVSAMSAFEAELVRFAGVPKDAAPVTSFRSILDNGTKMTSVGFRLNANSPAMLNAAVESLMASAKNGTLAAALAEHGLTLHEITSTNPAPGISGAREEETGDIGPSDGGGAPSAAVIAGALSGTLTFAALLLISGVLLVRRRSYQRLSFLSSGAVTSIVAEDGQSSKGDNDLQSTAAAVEPSQPGVHAHLDVSIDIHVATAQSAEGDDGTDEALGSCFSRTSSPMEKTALKSSYSDVADVEPVLALARYSRQSSKTHVQSLFSAMSLEGQERGTHQISDETAPAAQSAEASFSCSESDTSFLATYPYSPSSSLDAAPPLPAALPQAPERPHESVGDRGEQLSKCASDLRTQGSGSERAAAVPSYSL